MRSDNVTVLRAVLLDDDIMNFRLALNGFCKYVIRIVFHDQQC